MANEDRQPVRSDTESREQAKLIAAAAVGLLLLIFFLQNMDEVSIQFLWMDLKMDMIWALVLSALLGGLTVFLGMWFMGRRRARDES
jgi:uncharacterized integral membrane protein